VTKLLHKSGMPCENLFSAQVSKIGFWVPGFWFLVEEERWQA